MNPAVDYADAVRRVEGKVTAEVGFDPGNHTFLLTHGSRTAKAIVLVHGHPSSPAPFKALPSFLRPLVGWMWRVLPNFYIWDDPQKKADRPRRSNYLRLSTRALGQILRLSQSIQTSAQQSASAARSILVVTNLNDPAVDNTVTDRVVDLWRALRPGDVQTYRFPAGVGLGHDIISVDDPNANVDVVYPELLKLIDAMSSAV